MIFHCFTSCKRPPHAFSDNYKLAVCTMLLRIYAKNFSDNMELYMSQLRHCMQQIIFHKVDAPGPLLRRGPLWFDSCKRSPPVGDHLALHFGWLRSLACEQALCFGMGWKNREEREGIGWPFPSLSSRFFHTFPKQRACLQAKVVRKYQNKETVSKSRLFTRKITSLFFLHGFYSCPVSVIRTRVKM